jgi:ATP-dependent DNA helicase RecG
MTKLELLELIQNGENSGVEFKSGDVSSSELAIAIVCFANAKGGRILIGVEDDGTITGIRPKGREPLDRWVANIFRDSVKEWVLPYYEEIEVEKGKRVAVVTIDMGINKPYYVLDKSGKPAFYIRVVKECRIIKSKGELGRLFQASGLVHPDLIPITTASVDDLEHKKLREYFLTNRPNPIDIDSFSTARREQQLTTAKILTESATGKAPTLWALLLFGTNPQEHVPHSEAIYAHYQGADVGSRLLDQKTFQGTLIEIVENATTVLEAALPVISDIVGLKREEKPAIARKVLREALVNAVCHRQYAITGPVRLLLFSDRLEVISPGAPPNGVTEENMQRGGISVPRNYFLFQNLKNMNYVDMLGRGLEMIYKEIKTATGRDPRIEIRGEETRLILWQANLSENQ